MCLHSLVLQLVYAVLHISHILWTRDCFPFGPRAGRTPPTHASRPASAYITTGTTPWQTACNSIVPTFSMCCPKLVSQRRKSLTSGQDDGGECLVAFAEAILKANGETRVRTWSQSLLKYSLLAATGPWLFGTGISLVSATMAGPFLGHLCSPSYLGSISSSISYEAAHLPEKPFHRRQAISSSTIMSRALTCNHSLQRQLIAEHLCCSPGLGCQTLTRLFLLLICQHKSDLMPGTCSKLYLLSLGVTLQVREVI